jgi:predicted O-linked N-acetylglucosamine transferase (SPINDLY family)
MSRRNAPARQRPVQQPPADPAALTTLGIAMARAQRREEAAELLGRAAALQPREPSAHNNYGNALRELGRRAAALECYDRALRLAPDYPEAHYNRALVLYDLARFDEAVASCDRALGLKPDYAAAYNNRGAALAELGRLEEAVASYDCALRLKPDYVAAHCNRGVALQKLGFLRRALEGYERAIALAPDYPAAHNNRAGVLRQLDRLEEALGAYDRALALKPDYVEAHANRGGVLGDLGRIAEALASCDRALALEPDCAEALNNRGIALGAWNRFEEALASYARALAIEPEHAETLLNRGVALHGLQRFEEALASYEQALAVRPDDADTWRNRGLTLQELRRPVEALESYQRAVALAPTDGRARASCCHLRMQICAWTDLEADRAQFSLGIERGRAVVSPFVALSLLDAPGMQLRNARLWTRSEYASGPSLPPLRRYPWHQKVRVGYFSADFRNHAVSALAAELFEIHDRSRFELSAFCLGADVHDELRVRVQSAFERFIPVFDKSDEAVAALARSLEIDIAVDLGGYTRGARPRIFALRAAPIQVGYLGFLGTTGGDLTDYLLADAALIPPADRKHYAERIAYLPSYQVNDSRRPCSERVFSRAELGLPPAGFVFCCLNASYKITPETFASWMRILAAAPGSALLLLRDSAAAEDNLRGHALASGVDPARLVFAGRISYGDYIARYRSADLFLDTHPYNAGTTASDALWAGLPLLTWPGETFAARLGASLLTALGLPELIAAGRADYERLAVELATHPAQLGAIKARLAQARSRAALFDTPRFARSLEALFERMYRRYHLGLLPEHLSDTAEVLAHGR